MTGLAWIVLALVFVDEILVCVAGGVVGASMAPPWLFVWLLPLAIVAAWWAFASPKAPYGGRVVRPTVKVLVFGLASVGLWLIGHHTAAVALATFSLIVNALAQLRFVRSTMTTTGH